MYSNSMYSRSARTIVYSSSGSRDSIGGVYYVCTIVYYSIEAIIIMYNVQQTGAYLYDHVVEEVRIRVVLARSYYYYTTTLLLLLLHHY